VSNERAARKQFGFGSIFSSFMASSTNKQAELELKIELKFINELREYKSTSIYSVARVRFG